MQLQYHGEIQSAFDGPDLGEVGPPLLVKPLGLELTIQQVVGDSAALTTIVRQSPTFERRYFNTLESV